MSISFYTMIISLFLDKQREVKNIKLFTEYNYIIWRKIFLTTSNINFKMQFNLMLFLDYFHIFYLTN